MAKVLHEIDHGRKFTPNALARAFGPVLGSCSPTQSSFVTSAKKEILVAVDGNRVGEACAEVPHTHQCPLGTSRAP